MKPIYLIALLTIGCASIGPGDVKELGEDYVSIRGRIIAPPVLEDSDERMILYLETGEYEEGEEDRTIIMAVAVNKENERLLKMVSKRLSAVDEPVYLFGKNIEGKFSEYLEGLDFEVYAISYFDSNSKRYMTVVTTYGDSVADIFTSIGWSNFLKGVGKKAVSAAM